MEGGGYVEKDWEICSSGSETATLYDSTAFLKKGRYILVRASRYPSLGLMNAFGYVNFIHSALRIFTHQANPPLISVNEYKMSSHVWKWVGSMIKLGKEGFQMKLVGPESLHTHPRD